MLDRIASFLRGASAAHANPASSAAAAPAVVTRKQVEHVGADQWLRVGEQLDLSRGSPSSTSYEGIGLSVSSHPEAWAAIARLGDRAATLARVDGQAGRFAVYSAALAKHAAGWAVENGWATRETGWKVSYLDTEDDERRYIVCRTREEAEEELEGYGESGPPKAVPLLAATARMTERWRGYFAGAKRRRELDWHEVEIEALNLWLATAHPALDGVWWKERYDPARFSAPRGVILPHAASRWQVVRAYRLKGEH